MEEQVRLQGGQTIQLSETDPTDLWFVLRVTQCAATIRKCGKIKREITIERKAKMVKGVKRMVALDTPITRTIEANNMETLSISAHSFVKIIR